MDATQYKDYVLFMLFIKYVSDKYGNSDDLEPPITIPKGASFADMVALKGNTNIGDLINTQVIQPLVDSNEMLARTDFPDFNDPNKLGEGDDRVQRLSNLIAIFERQDLNFAKNRADHDDILGDAYEYLMRHFASESGKSKGQFYTPSEVSRIIAKVIGISSKNTVAGTTAYDPTCGSGSLLLKVAAEAGKRITLEGQEKDVTTAGLARMNMILHDFPTAKIIAGNTLTTPKFLEGERLRTYDYVVANPPFSDKAWSTGFTGVQTCRDTHVWYRSMRLPKRALRTGALQCLLTGETRLPSFSATWKPRRLGEHVYFLKNGAHSRAQLTTNDPVRYLHYGDIHVAQNLRLDLQVTDMPRLPTAEAVRLSRLETGDVVFVDASEDLTGIGNPRRLRVLPRVPEYATRTTCRNRHILRAEPQCNLAGAGEQRREVQVRHLHEVRPPEWSEHNGL